VKKRGSLRLWARASAAVWAAHWLVIVGSLLLFGSVLLKWVEFPFSRNLSGLQLPLLRNVGVIPHIYLLSFGVLGIVVLITGLALLRLSLPLLAVAAAMLVTLWVAVPCQIAFQRPALLRRLTDETQALPLVRVFTKEYLPQNYGAVEEIPKHLNVYNVWGRFVSAWSFLGVGWYCFGLGSLLIAVSSIRRLFGGTVVVTGLIVSCIPMGALAVLLARPIIAQHYFTSASKAKARGQNEEAISDYRKAMRWDRWHERNIDIYATIGDLERQSGFVPDSPEQHVSKAKEFKQAREYEPAVFELHRAAEAGGALALTARRESARTRVILGLGLYRAGAIGGAVTAWQQALAEDPSQVYALPYLARGNYDLGRYEAALEAIAQLVQVAADHNSVLGDAYSLGGDCYAKLGRDADARHYYNLSLDADPSENYWAMTGLIGE
jgi:tetratricopeptide (TPR) repeat protein